MDVSKAVLEAFQIEHKEQLEGIRRYLAQVSDGAPESGHDLDEAFRLAHSLKGGARVCNLQDVETLAHDLETTFSRIRENALHPEPGVWRVISLVLDAIEDYMSDLLQTGSPQMPTHVIEQMRTVVDGGKANAVADVALRRQVVEQSPKNAADSDVQPTMDQTAAHAAHEPVIPHDATVDTLRVRADHLDALLQSSDQLSTTSLAQQAIAQHMVALGHQIQMLAQDWDSVRRAVTTGMASADLVANQSTLQRHLTDYDQHLRAISRQERSLRRMNEHSTWSLRRLGEQLQHNVRRARMVTVASIYQGFRKMMRELARDASKQVDFVTAGLEVEADLMVLQALKDPIMHVLRNSIAHGIESPDIRKTNGKPETGQVQFAVESVGSRLRITIDDDGSGLSRDSIAEQAVRTGLISEEDASALPDDDIFRFIFHPGLSTQADADAMAGRGIGLSVLDSTVTRLQGAAHVSQPDSGVGTRFVIDVPQTISTQRVLLIACSSRVFAVPAHNINVLRRVRSSSIEHIENVPVIRVDGEPMPLLDLANLLAMPTAADSEPATVFSVIVLKTQLRKIALRVDQLLAERDAVIKDVLGPVGRIKTYLGGITLDDGAIALVVNPTALVNEMRLDRHVLAQSTVPGHDANTCTVLIVDDSFTTRTLEKSILEAHGYTVQVAVDGEEAYQMLQTAPVDLVISDVEMPRLDGFGLLKKIKSNPPLAEIPVIMVTSRDQDEDRQKGLRLGAAAYVVKQKFDHQELLNITRQCLGAPPRQKLAAA